MTFTSTFHQGTMVGERRCGFRRRRDGNTHPAFSGSSEWMIVSDMMDDVVDEKNGSEVEEKEK